MQVVVERRLIASVHPNHDREVGTKARVESDIPAKGPRGHASSRPCPQTRSYPDSPSRCATVMGFFRPSRLMLVTSSPNIRLFLVRGYCFS